MSFVPTLRENIQVMLFICLSDIVVVVVVVVLQASGSSSSSDSEEERKRMKKKKRGKKKKRKSKKMKKKVLEFRFFKLLLLKIIIYFNIIDFKNWFIVHDFFFHIFMIFFFSYVNIFCSSCWRFIFVTGAGLFIYLKKIYLVWSWTKY